MLFPDRLPGRSYVIPTYTAPRILRTQPPYHRNLRLPVTAPLAGTGAAVLPLVHAPTHRESYKVFCSSPTGYTTTCPRAVDRTFCYCCSRFDTASDEHSQTNSWTCAADYRRCLDLDTYRPSTWTVIPQLVLPPLHHFSFIQFRLLDILNAWMDHFDTATPPTLHRFLFTAAIHLYRLPWFIHCCFYNGWPRSLGPRRYHLPFSAPYARNIFTRYILHVPTGLPRTSHCISPYTSTYPISQFTARAGPDGFSAF